MTQRPKAETAMVMAAGLGTRMRPLTNDTPKPLVPLMGKPLIDHCFEHLQSGGVKKAVVNMHYLPEQIEAHFANHAFDIDVTLSDERELLMETGGGLVKALPMIDDDPFFCLNSDNIWENGTRNVFDALRDHWDGDKMDALLLLVPHRYASHYQGSGDFYCDPDGVVSRRKPQRIAPYIFSGIQLIAKKLLDNPPQGPFSTNIFWDRAIQSGRLYGIAHDAMWYDVGDPAALKKTEEALAGSPCLEG